MLVITFLAPATENALISPKKPSPPSIIAFSSSTDDKNTNLVRSNSSFIISETVSTPSFSGIEGMLF